MKSLNTLALFSPTICLSLFAISLIAGIWVQSLYAFSYSTICTYLILVLLISITLYYAQDIRYSSICFALFGGYSIGMLIYCLQWGAYNSFWEHIPLKPYAIKGIIVDIAPSEHLRTKQRITLQITELYTDQWHRYTGCIYLYTNAPTLRVDDSIMIKSIQFKKPNTPQFMRYLMREGVYGTLFYTMLDESALVYRPTYSCARFFAEWRHHVFDQLRTKMTQQTFALFSALFLGNRSFNKNHTDPINLLFKRWGIAHVYARSGLHLALLVWVWFMLMRLFPISYTLKTIILLSIGGMYSLLSWSSISFLRALIVFILCYICRLTYTPYRTFHILLVTCICTLIHNPLHLFFLDFQLSFGLTFALCLLQTK